MEFWIKFGRVSYPEASRNIINEDNEAAVPILLIRDNVDFTMAPDLAV
tara:strand:- start:205 stop:348 length:144 start_codon:yes stop_codon:yes gene_type:complete